MGFFYIWIPFGIISYFADKENIPIVYFLMFCAIYFPLCILIYMLANIEKDAIINRRK